MSKAKNETKLTEQQIESWFAKFFHNSAISRDENLIDIAIRAKEELKQMLFPSQPASAETTTNKE